jgi:D-3-phosphoglycerate dehydrogenase
MKRKVFITDYAWPELDLEYRLLESAGFHVVAGPRAAAPGAEIARIAAEHRPQVIMTCWAEVSAETIGHCRDLVMVQRIGVGLDNIDRRAAHACGALVTNVPDYCIEEVSDHAIALMLDWARGVVKHNREVVVGVWEPSRARPRRVRDLCVGIAGYGRIGRLAARKLQGFGVKLLAHNRQPAGTLSVEGAEHVGFHELLARSDVVMGLYSLSRDTHHIFGAEAFARMKPGSLFINVSRGGLVDNAALLAALDRGAIDAAALDVIEGEPAPPASVTSHPRVIATPHIAFSSAAAVLELRTRSCEEVIRVCAGQAPRNPCPPAD